MIGIIEHIYSMDKTTQYSSWNIATNDAVFNLDQWNQQRRFQAGSLGPTPQISI